MSNWTIAALPVLGVIVGVVLQFLLGRTANRTKQMDDLRCGAYADYLKGVASAAHLESQDELRSAHRDIADAKARIAIYGSARVISALARFEEVGAVIAAEGVQLDAFVTVVLSMRLTETAVNDRDFRLLLVGSDR